jgi:hypothetical protein
MVYSKGAAVLLSNTPISSWRGVYNAAIQSFLVIANAVKQSSIIIPGLPRFFEARNDGRVGFPGSPLFARDDDERA